VGGAPGGRSMGEGMDSEVEEGEIPDELNPGAEPARGERAAPEHSNAVRAAVNLVHACTMTPERCHHTLSSTLAETACSTCAVLKQMSCHLAGRQSRLTCFVPSCFVHKLASLRVQPAARAARCPAKQRRWSGCGRAGAASRRSAAGQSPRGAPAACQGRPCTLQPLRRAAGLRRTTSRSAIAAPLTDQRGQQSAVRLSPGPLNIPATGGTLAVSPAALKVATCQRQASSQGGGGSSPALHTPGAGEWLL
jgi:hypothetical protein